jgi:hypothetical protein
MVNKSKNGEAKSSRGEEEKLDSLKIFCWEKIFHGEDYPHSSKNMFNVEAKVDIKPYDG